MRVPASVQVALVSTGFVVVMGASGCSKRVDAAAAAETVAAVDVPASYDAPAEKNASRADREEPKRTERHADIASEQVESRLAPTDAWMFRGSRDESAAPVSTQGSITPQPQPQPQPKPTIQPQPPKPPSTAPVVVNQPQRPPGWQIRAACGRG